MTGRGPKNPERSFGLSVGAVLCVLAAIFVWRGRPVRAEIFGVGGGLLVVAGLMYPRLLKWPSAAWWAFSRALGYVNARVLLTILFGVVLVPLSLVWRLTGKDPLARGRGQWTGWSPYPSRYRDRRHYDRMY
jgi:hypothetical protein